MLKNEKKNKEKKTRSDRRRREVIGEGDDEMMMWKQKISGYGISGRKQESKKWEIKENETRRGFEKMIKEFEIDF